MRLTGKLLDVLFFVVGPILFLLGTFSFGHPMSSLYHPRAGVAYYYTDTALTLIVVGGGLVASGVVRRMWRK